MYSAKLTKIHANVDLVYVCVESTLAEMFVSLVKWGSVVKGLAFHSGGG